MEYSRQYSILKLLGLPLAPILGYLLDWRKISSYSPPRIQQMHRILILVVLASVLALLNSLLPFIPSLPVQIAGFVLQITERVTVLMCVCSFLMHVHFPVEHFGKYIGCHFLVASLSCLLGFAFQSLVHVHPDHNPIYVNLVLIVLLVIAWGHPINIWYHCHQGLIQDASENDFSSEIPTHQKLVTEPDTPSSV